MEAEAEAACHKRRTRSKWSTCSPRGLTPLAESSMLLILSQLKRRVGRSGWVKARSLHQLGVSLELLS